MLRLSVVRQRRHRRRWPHDGSDQVKTAEQAALFGGTAGIIMHPSYHTAADRLDNVNLKSLGDMSDAGAHAILWFAMDGQ
jgi:hypothetical protein